VFFGTKKPDETRNERTISQRMRSSGGPSCAYYHDRRLRVNLVSALTYYVYIIHIYYIITILHTYSCTIIAYRFRLYIYFYETSYLQPVCNTLYIIIVFPCPFCSLLSHIKYYDSRTNRSMLITEIPHNRAEKISNLTTCLVYLPKCI